MAELPQPLLAGALLDHIEVAGTVITADAAHPRNDTERRSGYRITRTIWVAPATGIDFPGTTVVFRLRRDVYAPHGQRISKQMVRVITSLAGTAADLLTYIRTGGSPEWK